MHKANWYGVAGRSALFVGVAALGAVAGGGCSGHSARYSPVYSSDPFTNNAGGGASANASFGATGPTYATAGGGAAYQGGAPPQPAGGGYAGNPQAGGPPPAAGDINGMLAAADRVLRAQGYQPGGTQPRNFAQGETFSFPLATQPGSCYTVFALGGPGANDVDLAIIAPSGRTVQQDTNTDPHPNVTFCPYEYGLHLARVTMFSGQGSVLFAVYQGPPNSQGNVASAFGGAQAAPAAAPGQADAATQGRIEAVRAQLTAAGYVGAGPVSGNVMRNGEDQDWPVTLNAGFCYAFGAFGGPGVHDADVFVLDSTGRRLAADAGTSVDALVQDVCPQATGTYHIHPRCYSGAGTVWFLPMAKQNPATATAGSAPATGTTPVAIAATASAGGGLAASFRGIERNLVQRGWAMTNQATSGQLASGASAQAPVPLQANQCYALVALGDSGLQSLDLVLLDPQNHEVDRDRTQSSQPIVRACPSTPGVYTARVTATGGEGQYRLGLMRWGSGTSGAGLSGLLFVRNAELTRILQADGYQADTDFDIVRANIRQGATVRRNVNLRAGTCYSMLAVGDAGVGDLDLSVHQGHTLVREDDTHSASPEARFCAQSAGRYEVTIHAAAGAGEYVFRVFKRQAQGATP